MPTYDYECAACGHEFELFQSMSDKPVKKCPACGKPKAQRLIGCGSGVIFKGSGFYETDYKRKSGNKSEGTNSSTSGNSSSDSSSASAKGNSGSSSASKSE